MPHPLPIARLNIHRLAIPMKQSFRHAAAQRSVAEPIIVEAELADGTCGWGETHPREYVTGECAETTLRTLREFFVPRLLEFRPSNFGEAIEAIADLPLRDEAGNVITAARAALELALLDAYSRAFQRSLDNIAGWLSDSWLGAPGSSRSARFGGVISGDEPARAAWSIRKMRLFGLRQFKVKVGDEHDEARLAAAMKALQPAIAAGRASLRIDANGAWTLEQAAERLNRWRALPITCVEQPLRPHAGGPADWKTLAEQTGLALMADESLVTLEDAEALVSQGAVAWFNIRLSKNGGLIPSLRLALAAHRTGVRIQLGCLVGETSILSAAARWFLRMVPDIQFAEGNYGSFLLRDDLTRRPLRFGYAGRWKPLTGPGLGVIVDPVRLAALRLVPALHIPL